MQKKQLYVAFLINKLKFEELMKKILLFTLIAITFFSCETKTTAREKISLDSILNRKFERSIISRGDNIPDFNIKKDKKDLFLVALHNDISIKDFQEKVYFSNDKIDSIISLLESKNWLHEIDGKFKPTVFIATKEDGEKLYKYAEPISKKIALKIKEQLSDVKDKFKETEISNKQTFEDWSFLILSNVLLDAWQIFNVESQFLGKSVRPIRHEKNYYASIKEVTTDREGFGIYGNQSGKISVYGNNRYKADLSSTDYFISAKDNVIFHSMANEFLPKLVTILNENKQYSEQVYEELGYSKEITFEEFFMWWYHFIYTQATNDMSEMNLLRIPENGNFVYEIER